MILATDMHSFAVRSVQCRKCGKMLPKREAVRLVMSAERVNPSGGDMSGSIYLCEACSERVSQFLNS